MADFPKVDRLKSQLITSGLQSKDPALFQIINTLIDFVRQGFNTTTEIVATSGGGGSSSGITALTTDVVATGPGAVVATIQPDAVTTAKVINSAITYAKIQDTVLPDILIGRGTPAGVLGEIELGANLQIVGDTLEITTSGGGTGGGLEHNLLSLTHPDTIAANAVKGDLIYAGEGATAARTFVNAVVITSLENDIPIGVYAGYMLGFDSAGLVAPTSGGYSIPTFALRTTPVPEAWLTWDLLDAFVQGSLIDDALGIYGYYNALVPGQSLPGPGNYGGYTKIPIALVAPPPISQLTTTGTWRRRPKGIDAQVLTLVSGLPEWEDLPSIPAEPSYPWNNITFNAANFTATGGATPAWTVAAGDVVRAQYQIFPGTVGSQNVRIAYYIKTSSVSGAGPPTQLQITLPFNILGTFALFISFRENNVAINNGALIYDDAIATNQLFIEKVPFGGTFDVTANETYLSFEISATLAP